MDCADRIALMMLDVELDAREIAEQYGFRPYPAPVMKAWVAVEIRDDEEAPVADDECPMCGWTRGTNPMSCGECAEHV